jgi:hypothetical protein
MRDGRTEQFLTRAGCEFTYEAAWPLEDIDFDEAERSNMARLGKRYDDNRAINYGQLWEDGLDFPAIIIFRPPAGEKADLADGLHRGRGALVARVEGKSKTMIDVYVIENEFDPQRREIIIRATNSYHGVGNTKDQNLAHIGEIYRKHPETPMTNVAKMFGMKIDNVRKYLKALDATDRARGLGLDDIISSPVFTQDLKGELEKIHSDTVFTRVIQTIWDAKLKGDPAKTLTVACKRARKESDAFAICDAKLQEVIDDTRRAKAVLSTPARGSTPNNFINLGRKFANFPKDNMIKNVHLDALPPSTWGAHIILLEQITEVANAARDELIRLTNLKNKMDPTRTGDPSRVH